MKHHRLDLHRFSAVHLVQAGFRLALPGALAMGLCWQVPLPRLPAVLLLAAALGIVQGASFAAIPQLNAGERESGRWRPGRWRNWAIWAPPPARHCLQR